MLKPINALLVPIGIAAALSACSGGGSSGGTAGGAGPTSFNGLAATGAAIANGQVTAKCAVGSPMTTSTDSNGAFQFTLASTQSTPCMLRVAGGSLGTSHLYGFTDGGGRVNVTPITDLIVTKALASDPSVAFSTFSTTSGNLIKSNLTAAVSYVKTQILNITNSTVGIDPLNGTFAVGDSSDKVLDSLGDAMRAANKTLEDIRTSAQAGNDLATLVPNQNVLAAIVGTYDSGCVKTNVGSAQYTLTVNNPTGTNSASVSLRAKIFATDFNPVASFVASDNSLEITSMPILPVAGTCNTASTDITIVGKIKSLASAEAYLALFAAGPGGGYDGWANQVEFKLDSATFTTGSLSVTTPAFGTTAVLGYKIKSAAGTNNKFYFVSGKEYSTCPTPTIAGINTTTCRYIDPTYLTKQ